METLLTTMKADVHLGLHLRSWPNFVEGESGRPNRPDIDTWANWFFDCAEKALDRAKEENPDAKITVYFATDEPKFRSNATERLGPVFTAPEALGVTHTRPWTKKGTKARTDAGGDAAVLDFAFNYETSHYFVGTRASTFSDGIIEAGCLVSLRTHYQLDSQGACQPRRCEPHPRG